MYFSVTRPTNVIDHSDKKSCSFLSRNKNWVRAMHNRFYEFRKRFIKWALNEVTWSLTVMLCILILNYHVLSCQKR